jgi:hypothetical protein
MAFSECDTSGVVRTGRTQAIQQHYGHVPVPITCPECGLARAPLETFPPMRLFGLAGVAWARRGRRPIFSSGLECPRCHRPLRWAEDMDRRSHPHT